VEGLLSSPPSGRPDLKREPKPFVIQRSLSDFYVDYRLYAYTDESARRLFVQSQLHEKNVRTPSIEFGVQIMSARTTSAIRRSRSSSRRRSGICRPPAARGTPKG